MTRALLGCILAGLTAAVHAQTTIALTFPSAGAREVWVDMMPPESLPERSIKTEGATFELKAGNPGASDQVFVWDKASGNLAVKPVKQAAPAWTVGAADFKWIMRLYVRVEHKGQPVETASVRLRDGRQDVTRLIDSSAKGMAAFFAVKPGPIRILVTYTSGGKTMDPIEQTVDLKLAREKPEPVLVVGIADPVPTVADEPESAGSDTGAAATPGSAGQDKSAPGTAKGPDATNPLGGLLSFLIAVAVGALIFWFGLQWVRKNQDRVQQKLEEMGVQVPKAPDQDAGSTTVAAPVAPAPPEKILLDNADPIAPVPGPAASSIPRLVGESGMVFEIPDGESLVSREAGDLVVAGESTVSRRHATLRRDGGRVFVRDEGSTNGTFVNGRRIDEETEIARGDQVQFGGARFRFEG